MPSPTPSPLPESAQRLRLWLAYAATLLVFGLLLTAPQLQRYLEHGGPHPWEPFLWELSSLLCNGLLGVALYRWHVAGLGRPRLLQIGRHALGAAVYFFAHVGGMFAIRFAVYAVVGVEYHPGSAANVLSYELGKDLVAYGLFVVICHGIHLFFSSQRQALQLQRLQQELAEARFARLAEQVQPHFLFNTLNLISSVMYEDVAKADRILCQLATLLRQALDAERQGWHSLDEELTLVQPFLEIMQARFGERLQVQLDIAPDARRCRLPALLLITPLENAIKHDVAQALQNSCVSLRAWCETGPTSPDGDRLKLRVHNSGTAPQRLSREGSIGLPNLRARLQAAYGDAAALHFGAAPEGGSELLLDLPSTMTPTNDATAADR
ncbi:histidine kinase [Paucibacter sp. APW11]|uniref:Histidine kinase n=1 Tax=Roseateles aquae TaxID=3077235 RepID=A0ABU3PAH0_9BURK|nr:histidine kinase [Paucibacter sp. APW11]MDT8999586.1 histidine kinase [Paucibacter sp. APW11]